MNPLTFPILKQLSDGKFHSGEALAKHFNTSRTTIWNALQEAEALGVEIFSIRGRGYKLPQPVVLLEEHAILKAIGEQRAWFQLEIHDHLDSTNTYLAKKASTGQAHASCVVAHLQSQGRGRRGRQWKSGLGTSLTFSLLWRFQCGASALSGLSLAVGVAIIRALHDLDMTQAQLKWPNDVLIGKNKLAGILIELQGDMEGPSAAVIGIGINLNLPDKLLRKIDQPTADLASITAQAINPNLLLGHLLKHLATTLSQFEQQGFASVRDEWIKHHAYHQKAVTMFYADGREVQGVVRDVAEDGILQIETVNGLQRFSSGEISLREGHA